VSQEPLVTKAKSKVTVDDLFGSETVTPDSKAPPKFDRDVRMRPLSALKASRRNPRTHSDDQIKRLADSIQRFGWTNPILVAGSKIIAGHGRRLAALMLGLEMVPTLDVSDLSEKEQRALLIADNQLALMAGWDEQLLSLELSELQEANEDLEGLGFRFEDLEDLLTPPGAAEGALGTKKAEPGDTEFPPPNAPPQNPETQAGDLWILGPHRVLCGDSRDPAQVAHVMEGLPVDLMLTDPPYCSGGYQEAGKRAGTWGTIASDNLSSRGYQALIKAILTAAAPQAFYLFFDWRMWTYISDTIESSGLPVRSILVWDKGTPGMGAVWRTQHEMVIFASRKNNKRVKGVTAYGNVLKAKRTGNHHHYTEKPTDLLEQILRGDECTPRKTDVTVFDPFTGSGSTLLACHARGRDFRGLEIEPGYCDVIAQRFEASTGVSPVRVAGSFKPKLVPISEE
jgi:DNA modification methylase